VGIGAETRRALEEPGSSGRQRSATERAPDDRRTGCDGPAAPGPGDSAIVRAASAGEPSGDEVICRREGSTGSTSLGLRSECTDERALDTGRTVGAGREEPGRGRDASKSDACKGSCASAWTGGKYSRWAPRGWGVWGVKSGLAGAPRVSLRSTARSVARRPPDDFGGSGIGASTPEEFEAEARDGVNANGVRVSEGEFRTASFTGSKPGIVRDDVDGSEQNGEDNDEKGSKAGT
jgi:hypothetical protein